MCVSVPSFACMKTVPSSARPDPSPPPARTAAEPAARGAAIYSRRVLFFYDFLVIWFSSRFVWRCPAPVMLSLYHDHVRSRHLEVGVGTGYFLDHCRFPEPPELSLADLNPNPLAVASRRLARYQPRTFLVNILEPLPFAGPAFDSIGLNYVLHCLPGTMAQKAPAIWNLKAVLNPGGVLFGSTVLGHGVRRNPLARILMRLYNARGVFSNRQDTPEALQALLRQSFSSYQVQIQGCVVLFWAQA